MFYTNKNYVASCISVFVNQLETGPSAFILCTGDLIKPI